MSRVIYSISESKFEAGIKKRISQRTPSEVYISALLYFNVVTILAVSLAASGLSVTAFGLYLITAYCLVLINVGLEIYFKGRGDTPDVGSFIESLSILAVFFFNGTASSSASPSVVIVSVCVVTFLTLPVSVRSFSSLIVRTSLIFMVCFIYFFYMSDVIENKVNLVFPITISFIIVLLISYWLFIRHINFLHHQLELSYFKSEIERKNESLIAAEVTLKNEHALREKMIRHVGHDLRQPINTISYSLFNMDESLLTMMQLSHVDTARRSVDEANYLIEDILKISSYKNYDIESDVDIVRIQDLFDLLKREYDTIADLKSIRLTTLPCSLSVNSDFRLLTRILRNFLSNAVRHSNTQKITIGARRRVSWVDVYVIDQGVGIPKLKMDNLYIEFSENDEGISSSNFGLGISIAKSLADICNAKITILSKIGRGTSCILSLPR